MKVTALGGSAAGPNTRAGCAGLLVQHGTTSVVLDLGPGTLLELRKHIDFRDLTAVIISHYHLDHILDLGALRYHLAYNPVPAPAPIRLCIPPGSSQRFDLWARTFGHDDEPDFFAHWFTRAEYDPAAGLSFPGLSISFAPTVHPTPGWAMRVSQDNGVAFGYTADSGPTANLAELFQGVKLLISEATETNAPVPDSASRGHLTAFEAAELARDASADILMVTHSWEEDGLERAATDAATRFDGSILIARPGLSVRL